MNAKFRVNLFANAPQIALAVSLSTIFASSVKAETSQSSLSVSGFSRVVAGILDDENASFEGYDNSVSFGERSLLGVQIDAHLNEHFSVTSQLLYHSSDQRDSGIEWLYLTYRPSKSVRFKAGRMRTPFFSYSDVLDVGFAYPWISPPQQVYNAYLFDYYDGLSASYEIGGAGVTMDIEGYVGEFNDSFFIGNDEVNANTDDYRGVIVNIRGEKLHARLSTHRASVDVDLPELDQFATILRQANFPLSANSLATTGDIKVEQVGLNYDDLNYFFKTELIKIAGSSLIVPEISSYYFTAGYISHPFTFHATYATNTSDFAEPSNEIRRGVIPELDLLAENYDAVFNSLANDTLESLTLGVRWDFKLSMALKLEYTHLKGEQGERSFFEISNDSAFDRRANLVQVAWEWVF